MDTENSRKETERSRKFWIHVESKLLVNTNIKAERAPERAPERAHFVPLRPVPAVLKNGCRRLVVNALLDDASTKTYINGDVAAGLGLEGTVQKITFNVLNGGKDSFQTMPVELDLHSVDGKTITRISTFTATSVTGNMQPVDWKRQGCKVETSARHQFSKPRSPTGNGYADWDRLCRVTLFSQRCLW